MVYFDASKEWTILLPPDVVYVKKAAEDLSRYIGLLAKGVNANVILDDVILDDVIHDDEDGVSKAPIVDAFGPAPEGAVIVLSSSAHGCERNGFSWRIGKDRVEISGDSGRGLCNGIYSFLAALGISWPAPGQEELPSPLAKAAHTTAKDPSGDYLFPLADAGAFSLSEGDNPPTAAQLPQVAHLRRFFLPEKSEIKKLLNKGEAFVEWAARSRYDALVFPLAAYASGSTGRKLELLRQAAEKYGIAMEAGGWELSSLVPRRHFLLHRDFFRMDDGKRKKDHHFCPTNPDVAHLIAKESERLFRSVPEATVIHLWPDKGAETAWCSCPTCRAFSSLEQNRIAINVAADALAALNRDTDRDANSEAFISYFEKPGEGGKIKPRKNTFSVSEVP